jgi:hypothetical protein
MRARRREFHQLAPEPSLDNGARMNAAIKPWDAPPPPKPESRAHRAQRALRNAGIERRLALQGGSGAAAQLKDAERLEASALEWMKPEAAPTVRNGEVMYADGGSGPSSEVADTLRNPDQAAIDASVARTDLLLSSHTDIVALGVDAAASVKADNSLQKMLAHQLALIHVLVMKTGAQALSIESRRTPFNQGLTQPDSVELGRLAGATSRLSSTFQEGLLTLQRLRNGGSQTVTVRHVTVQTGGQAIIGNVEAGGGGRRATGRGKTK